MRQVYIEAEKNFFPFGFFPTAAKIVLQLGNKKEICSHERLFLSLSLLSRNLGVFAAHIFSERYFQLFCPLAKYLFSSPCNLSLPRPST